MPPAPPVPPIDPSVSPDNELYVSVDPINKLYTDNTGRFLVRSYRGNQYIMIASHFNYNAILQVPFQTVKYMHRIAAYSFIMKCLKSCNHSGDLQILYNKSSADYR